MDGILWECMGILMLLKRVKLGPCYFLSETMRVPHSLFLEILMRLFVNWRKKKGCNRPKFLIEAFCEVLSPCELRDLGFAGSMFTWCNNRDGQDSIFERLDCCVENSGWLDLFSRCK